MQTQHAMLFLECFREYLQAQGYAPSADDFAETIRTTVLQLSGSLPDFFMGWPVAADLWMDFSHKVKQHMRARSLQQLDLTDYLLSWLDACQSAYDEIAVTPSFRDAYQKHQQQLWKRQWA